MVLARSEVFVSAENSALESTGVLD